MRAPERILSTHPPDQFSNLARHWRPPESTTAAFPRPKQPEACAMPRNDGFRSDDDECRSPSGPDAGQPRPQEAIRRRQLGRFTERWRTSSLVTKREDLQLKGCAAAER